MKITRAAFENELPGWVLRGALCAVNSAFWAWMMGFQHPAEIAGMAAGVAFWVAVFAGVCAWIPQLAWWKQAQIGAALKRAAWIKIGLTMVGWLFFAVASALRVPGAQWVGMLGMVDTLLGVASLWLVSQVGPFRDFEQIPRVDSFGWTALTTVVEGALMAVVIGLLTLAVLAWWRWGAGLARKHVFSRIETSG